MDYYYPIADSGDEILLVYCAMAVAILLFVIIKGLFRDRRTPLDQYHGTACAWCTHLKYSEETFVFTCDLTGESDSVERRKHYPKCPYWRDKRKSRVLPSIAFILWFPSAITLLVGMLFFNDYLFRLENTWILMLGIIIVVIPGLYGTYKLGMKWENKK